MGGILSGPHIVPVYFEDGKAHYSLYVVSVHLCEDEQEKLHRDIRDRFDITVSRAVHELRKDFASTGDTSFSCIKHHCPVPGGIFDLSMQMEIENLDADSQLVEMVVRKRFVTGVVNFVVYTIYERRTAILKRHALHERQKPNDGHTNVANLTPFPGATTPAPISTPMSWG
jgi:hypothetical protein